MVVYPLTVYALGTVAAICMGLSKTGLPGAAILGVAILAEAFPENAKLSVGAMLPILLVGDLFAVAYFRRFTQWNRLSGLFPFVFVGMIVASVVLKCLDGNQLRSILGAIIFGLVILEGVRRKFKWESIPQQGWFVVLMGFLSGFGTTMGNVAGPIMGIYLLAKGLKKEEFIGTAAWFFLIINLCKVPFFLGLGMITKETLSFDLVVAPFIVVGALLGVFLLSKMSQAFFNALVMGLAAVAAIHLMVA